MPRRPMPRRADVWFLGASALGYVAVTCLVRSDRTPGDIGLFLALLLGLSALWGLRIPALFRRPPTLRFALGGALLLRLALLPAGFDIERNSFQRLLLYDDDIWRYLWEGHTWGAGVDPFLTPPEPLEEYELELTDPALHARLYDRPAWGEIWDNIGYRQFASPYGWTAHAVFALAAWAAPASVWALKLLLIAFDLGVVWLLGRIGGRLGQGAAAAAVYGWCPLAIKEIAGSGHLDSILIFFLPAAALSLMRNRGRVSGWATAAAGLVKPSGFVLAPLLWKRCGWTAVAAPAAAVALLAWHMPEGMRAYVQSWTFNPLLARLLPEVRWLEIAFPLVATGAVALWRCARDDGSPRAVIDYLLWTLGAFLLTTPMLAPWYVLWILPFAALRREPFWLAYSGAVFLSYHYYLASRETAWVVALEVAAPALIWLFIRMRRQPAVIAADKPVQL